MIESIIIGFLVAVVTALIIMYLKLRKSHIDLLHQLLEQGLASGVLRSKINELTKEIEQAKLEKSDGFVKFLSDSRQWAFDYIENIQAVIKQLNVALENKEPKANLVKIYKELESFLPKEEEEKR